MRSAGVGGHQGADRLSPFRLVALCGVGAMSGIVEQQGVTRPGAADQRAPGVEDPLPGRTAIDQRDGGRDRLVPDVRAGGGRGVERIGSQQALVPQCRLHEADVVDRALEVERDTGIGAHIVVDADEQSLHLARRRGGGRRRGAQGGEQQSQENRLDHLPTPRGPPTVAPAGSTVNQSRRLMGWGPGPGSAPPGWAGP